jgi:glycosyltransferase involved in cell wall biosynthesis
LGDRALGGISVVVTTRNDEAGLAYLLPALSEQTRAPDEVVFVDGGSDDRTLEILKSWCEQAPTPTRVLVKPGANISAGRNAGVEAAANDWIACTDAGCSPVPEWLEAFDAARPDNEFLSGIFVLDSSTDFERALAVAHYPDPDELEATDRLSRLSRRFFGRRFEVRSATGRSMAFTRRAWAAVRGFPEELYAGEDIAFSAAVVDAGFASALEPRALVGWRPRPSWSANARMYWHYARGEVRHGRRRRQLVRGCAWLAGTFAVLAGGRGARALAAFGAVAYLALPIARVRRQRLPVRVWWRIPLMVAAKDLSQLAGSLVGTLDQLLGRAQPTPRP